MIHTLFAVCLLAQSATITTESKTQPRRDFIGAWLDEGYKEGLGVVIYRENGKLYLGLRSTDPKYWSHTPDDEMIESKSKLGRKFQAKELDDHGDFYILDKTGNLQGWDARGFVRTMRVTNFRKWWKNE